MAQRHAFILYSGPHSPKNSLAQILVDRGYYHFDMGQILREMVVKDPTTTNVIIGAIRNGRLVKESVINRVVSDQIPVPIPDRMVFTGVPRTLKQTDYLIELLQEDYFRIVTIIIDIDFEVAQRGIGIEEKDLFLARHEAFISQKSLVLNRLKARSDAFRRFDGNGPMGILSAGIASFAVTEIKAFEKLLEQIPPPVTQLNQTA